MTKYKKYETYELKSQRRYSKNVMTKIHRNIYLGYYYFCAKII